LLASINFIVIIIAFAIRAATVGSRLIKRSAQRQAAFVNLLDSPLTQRDWFQPLPRGRGSDINIQYSDLIKLEASLFPTEIFLNVSIRISSSA
jgi:hypothetical protein